MFVLAFVAMRWASEPNILKRDGGDLSSGNSTLMQRERGKKEAKAGKRKQRFGRSVKSAGRRAGVGRGCAGCTGCRAGGGKSGGTVSKKAEREQAEQQAGESKR